MHIGKAVVCMSALLLALSVAACEPGVTDTTDTAPSSTEELTREQEETTGEETPEQEENQVLKNQIIISAFWPPMKGFVTEEQFQYLADAGIDLLEYNSDPLFTDTATIEAMLQLCEKYGISVTLMDKSCTNWLTASDSKLERVVTKYMQNPAVAGFYLVDEPSNANPYGEVVRKITALFPGAICQMNMLPMQALADARGHAEDFVSSAGAENLRYLSFDAYPFGVTPGSVPQMYGNLDLVRTVGLKYNVDTACYIQSVSNMVGFRMPTVEETRFHTSAALAYGFKNLKYFTWMTPVDRGNEEFTDAIIKRDGQPNDTYEGICGINSDIKKVSTLLAGLDAVQIYHNGRVDAATQPVPDDYVITVSGTAPVIVSLMKDRESNRNYIMLVNKDFKRTRTIEFGLNTISSLTEVTDGTQVPVTVENGAFFAEIKAGGFRLYALDEGVDISTGSPDASSRNLAYDKPVTSSSSVGQDGCYNYKAVDGLRFGDGSSGCYRLQRLSDTEENYYMVDLYRTVEINRVDVYPFGKGEGTGEFFPAEYDVMVSQDGINFTKVASYTGGSTPQTVPVHTFEKTGARYVKLVFKGSSTRVELSEVEIYNDDGDVPPPTEIRFGEPDVTKNKALGKTVTVSSDVANWGWSRTCLTDGIKADGSNPGWSSQVKLHMRDEDADAEEWFVVDLGEKTDISSIILYPRAGGGYFPGAYQILASDDAVNYSVIVDYDDGGAYFGTFERVHSFSPVSARYIKVLSKRMTMPQGSVDGYLFQTDEIEIY